MRNTVPVYDFFHSRISPGHCTKKSLSIRIYIFSCSTFNQTTVMGYGQDNLCAYVQNALLMEPLLTMWSVILSSNLFYVIRTKHVNVANINFPCYSTICRIYAGTNADKQLPCFQLVYYFYFIKLHMLHIKVHFIYMLTSVFVPSTMLIPASPENFRRFWWIHFVQSPFYIQ